MMTESKVDRLIGELKSCDLLEKVAVGVSSATILAFVVFWSFQVRSVIELLQLAYG